MFDGMIEYFARMTVTEAVWVIVGFGAQALFSMRFIIQWFVSERAKRSIVPVAFWYFSIAGGSLLFAYSIYRGDPVFMVGQGGGLIIYLRNLYFIHKNRGEEADKVPTDADAEQPAPKAASKS
jgi:lipid-A-disaccharide synthase-like uncharacterized protein